MAQSTQVQGRNLPFSRVAIAHPVKGQPVRLVVQVPVNISFGTNVKIQTGDADTGIAVSFVRCTPNGCFADFDIKDDVLKKFRAATPDVLAKLKFVLASLRRLKLFQTLRPPGETAPMELPNIIPRKNKDDGYRNGEQRHLCSHVVGQTVARMLAGHCHRISPQAFSARAESRDRTSEGPDYPSFRVPGSANDQTLV